MKRENITRPSLREGVLSLESIDRELRQFEESERRRLGLEPREKEHWRDLNLRTFRPEERNHTTILLGGLSVAHDHLISAALRSLGYRFEMLECPDLDSLKLGREFGSRGQCNPAYFTVGNLIKRLIRLRDEENLSVDEIRNRYVFFTAGACDPCRFGTYATEYRKALRDAGFEGFRVILFQQTGGFRQAAGPDSALDMNPRFFVQMVKAIIAGDFLNAMGYRIRPYETRVGQTDAVLEECKGVVATAFEKGSSICLALRKCRRRFATIEVDRLQPKPKVMILGEFWAMTTEGDGNYRLQRFLEEQGAEVEVQDVSAWLLYLLWQARRDTGRRRQLGGEDNGRRGLAGVDVGARLRTLWFAERALRCMLRLFAHAIGLHGYRPACMDEIADLASGYYDHELRGGEGHMEVGKLIQSVIREKAHMVISVKPFGCLPSSGVSDGIQSLVQKNFPEAVFCPVETTGDGAVNFQSRVLMFLFKARRNARGEFEKQLEEVGMTAREVRERMPSRWKRGDAYPPHIHAGSAASLAAVLGLRGFRRS